MQVADDRELLDLMMADMAQADELYRPTNYWQVYERPTLRELNSEGLRDFRRRQNSALTRAGASDLYLEGGICFSRRVRNYCASFRDRFKRRFTLPIRVAGWIDRALGAAIPVQFPYGMREQQIRELALEIASCKAQQAGAKPLQEFDASLAGNPEGVFQIDGHNYTMSMLYYYLRYVYCCKYVDFETVRVFVELGSGSGKQLELLRKLYPHITFLVFDIPPQLYVCEQYLKAVFPDWVVSYRETRELETIEALGDVTPGALCILPTWKFLLLSDLPVDLFWNAASFQEMEPHAVANYLQVVNAQAEWVFLQELFSGKPQASAPGEPGVIKPVTLEDYQAGLSEFEMVDMSPSWGPLGVVTEEGVYCDSVWRRKREPPQ
jgi:putative sugar O-methyltransferase